MRTHDTTQSGSIMVLVMVILVALLSAGAVAVGLLVSDTRTTSIVRNDRTAMFCAEAGLEAVCPTVTLNRKDWDDVLDGGSVPSWYDVPAGGVVGIEGDIDGDGTMDYRVTIQDNAEADGDPTADTDNRVFLVSNCINNPRFPRTLLMLIETSLGGGINASNDENRNSDNTVNGSCSKF